MIKSELIQRISSQNPHLYQRDIEKIVNAILDEIIEALRRGDRVELRGFGAFSAKLRGARQGRNPRTGAAVPVAHDAARRVVLSLQRINRTLGSVGQSAWAVPRPCGFYT